MYYYKSPKRNIDFLEECNLQKHNITFAVKTKTLDEVSIQELPTYLYNSGKIQWHEVIAFDENDKAIGEALFQAAIEIVMEAKMKGNLDILKQPYANDLIYYQSLDDDRELV